MSSAGGGAIANIFDVFSRSMKSFTSKSSEESACESSAAATVNTPPSFVLSNESERSRREQPILKTPPWLSAKIENSPHKLHPQAVEER